MRTSEAALASAHGPNPTQLRETTTASNFREFLRALQRQSSAKDSLQTGMSRNAQSSRESTRSSTSFRFQPRILYLTVYNLLFAALWAWVGISAIAYIGRGKFVLFETVEPRARWIQTLTLIEVAHAAIGLVRSPVSTTAIQVFTRVIQVWMIWYSFPASTAASYAFFVLLLAWSVADSIRYMYLTLNLHGKAPQALAWLRYTMFYPLYPIGIGAEWWLMYQSVEPVGKVSPVLPPVFYFLLALYVPGAYTMLTYMVKQRKKTLGRSEQAVQKSW